MDNAGALVTMGKTWHSARKCTQLWSPSFNTEVYEDAKVIEAEEVMIVGPEEEGTQTTNLIKR